MIRVVHRLHTPAPVTAELDGQWQVHDRAEPHAEHRVVLRGGRRVVFSQRRSE